MKRSVTVLALLASLAIAPAAGAGGMDHEGIKAAVVAAYVEGIHINGDPEAIRAGFHPDFVMSILRDGEIVQVTRDEWIERIEEGRAKREANPKPDVAYEFTHVDQTANAAVARIELHRDGEHVYTDYLSLYRFADGWKIVGKIFASHR